MSFRVVVLSSHAPNLVPCVSAVLENEPDLTPGDIIVVDDGARASAEVLLPQLHWLTGIKPFVFARNANLGICAARTDVILLNDDARLVVPRGFSLLAAEMQRHPEAGVCSAGIRGVVGNPRQIASNPTRFRYEERAIAFVCVFLPWHSYTVMGPLDEQFVGYGFEDNDYCARVLAAGLKIGIWDGCVVDHSGVLPSTFRTRPDITNLFEENRRRYRSKWGREL
jgi:GT2 family glycosyltransferase